MNATSLYVSTCRLVLQSNAEDSASWTDLFRLLPYLRQSLSCTVCGHLLIEPYTPTETNCQHHVCKSCKGGKKKLKPSCSWCKDYEKYVENVQLRILLQCYKKLCEYITSTTIFKMLGNTHPPTNNTTTNLLDGTTPTLINLIQEGSGFADEFRTSTTVSRPAINSLPVPCVSTNTTSTQTNSASSSVAFNEDKSCPQLVIKSENPDTSDSPNIMQNGESMYSVLYAGSGHKLTFKRKASELVADNSTHQQVQSNAPTLLQTQVNQVHQPASISAPPKKPSRGRTSQAGSAVKTGCRCGNATATPGKLTCCGQRCACYTESKPCIDCKCRGCRNPHTADGQKVVQNYQLQLSSEDGRLVTGPQCISLGSTDMATASGGTVQVVGLQLHSINSTPILLDANTTITCGVNSEEDASDVDIDV